MKLRYISLLLVLLFIFGCKSSKESQSSENGASAEQSQKQNLQNEILGSWEWMKTVCCFRTPKTVTPDSLGYKKVLKFREDQTVDYFQDGKQTRTDSFKVSYGLMDDDRPVLKIGNGKTALLYIRNDTMIVDYGYMDLQTEYYKRVKE